MMTLFRVCGQLFARRATMHNNATASPTHTTWSLSVPDREKIIKAAFEAKEHAYCPYSRFRVGAALLTTDGSIVKGANVENASSGATICAERTAICKAVSEGQKAFVALAVVSDLATPVSPCGMYRQVMREFCSLNIPVFLVPADYPQSSPPPRDLIPSSRRTVGTIGPGGVVEVSLDELLPISFGPEHMSVPRFQSTKA